MLCKPPVYSEPCKGKQKLMRFINTEPLLIIYCVLKCYSNDAFEEFQGHFDFP